MSGATLGNLPEVQVPNRSCCNKRVSVTKDAEVDYDPSTWQFQIHKGSFWGCCFTRARRHQTWQKLRIVVGERFGQQITDLAFVQTNIKLLADNNSALTLDRYNALKRKATELNALMPCIQEIWKAIKLYHLFQTTELEPLAREVLGVRTQDPATSFNLSTPKSVISASPESGETVKSLQSQRIYQSILKIPCNGGVRKSDGRRIVSLIERDLEQDGRSMIFPHEISSRIIKYLKAMEYQMTEPESWTALQSMAHKSLDQLNTTQFGEVVKAATLFSQRRVDMDTKDSKESERSHSPSVSFRKSVSSNKTPTQMDLPHEGDSPRIVQRSNKTNEDDEFPKQPALQIQLPPDRNDESPRKEGVSRGIEEYYEPVSPVVIHISKSRQTSNEENLT